MISFQTSVIPEVMTHLAARAALMRSTGALPNPPERIKLMEPAKAATASLTKAVAVGSVIAVVPTDELAHSLV